MPLMRTVKADLEIPGKQALDRTVIGYGQRNETSLEKTSRSGIIASG